MIEAIYAEYGESAKSHEPQQGVLFTATESTFDRQQVDRFLAGHEVSLNARQLSIAEDITETEFSLGNSLWDERSYTRKPSIPTDFAGEFTGKKRAKILAKRAKDKSNRKKARRH